MKKVMSMLIVLTLLLSCVALTVNADYGYNYQALKGTPEIDGEIDAIWNDERVEWTTVDHAYSADQTRADQLLRVKILWDEDALYFLAELQGSEENLADFGNVFEVYISEANTNAAGDYTTGDSQTCIRFVDGTFVIGGDVPEANIKGGEGMGTNSKWATSTAASKQISGGYLVEAKLPFATIKGEVGKDVGLEFMLNIMDANATFINALRWNVDTANALGAGADAAPWASTEAWGALFMTADVATAPAAPETPDAPVTPENPDTGDSFVLFAVVALISLAGAVVVSKKRA